MSGTPFSNVNNIHVHSMIPEDQKNMTTQWCVVRGDILQSPHSSSRTWNRTRPFPSPISNTRSAHTVSCDRHTTNTSQVRIAHGPVRLFRSCTASYDLKRSLAYVCTKPVYDYTHSNTTKNTTNYMCNGFYVRAVDVYTLKKTSNAPMFKFRFWRY